MAENRNQVSQPGPEKPQSLQRREGATFGTVMMSPFSLMAQLLSELDRMFDAFGSGGAGGGLRSMRGIFQGGWAPTVEAFEKDGRLVVRADLPGLSPDDIRVEALDDAIVIQGERRSEMNADDPGGLYRTERVYGRFARTVPLPEGARVEEARARFDNGVLEISIPLAGQANRRRRIEIEGARRTDGGEAAGASSGGSLAEEAGTTANASQGGGEGAGRAVH